MCGISGWNLTEKPKDSFYLALAAVMETRGDQSHGHYNGDEDAITVGVGSIIEEVEASKLSCLAGFLHTRHATHGSISVENCHPFRFPTLVGAHNGVIYNHDALNLALGRKHKVDSLHIFSHLEEGLPLDEIRGYGAIEMFRNGEYFVGRCNGGELSIARTSIGMVWASEETAILAACKQSGIKLDTFFTVEQGKMYRVTSDNVWETDHKFNLSEDALLGKKGKKWDEYNSANTPSNTMLSGDSRFSGSTDDFSLYDESGREYTDAELRERFAKLDKQLDDELELNNYEVFEDYESRLGVCQFCENSNTPEVTTLQEVVEIYDSLICEDCFYVVR